MPAATTVFKPPHMRQVARQALLQHVNRLAIGTRLPSLQDLARDLGIGRNNVQIAMRDLASEGLVVSRPKLGTFVARRAAASVGKLPGKRARLSSPQSLAQPRTFSPPLAGKCVAIVTGDFTEPLLMTIARAARAGLESAGARIVERPIKYSAGGAVHPVPDCDLALLINPSMDCLQHMPAGSPTVVASTSWHESFVDRMPCDMIGVDQFGGAVQAGKLLRQLGFPSACFLGVRHRTPAVAWYPICALRLRGLEAGFGQPISPEHHLRGIGYSLEGGGTGFRRYLERPDRPPAIFAACDEMAVGFIIAAEAQGLRAGHDFHMIGFDGHRLGRQLSGGTLTTIDVPLEAMGHLAAELAMQRILRPRRPTQITYLTCQLHRGATAAPAQKLQVTSSMRLNMKMLAWMILAFLVATTALAQTTKPPAPPDSAQLTRRLGSGICFVREDTDHAWQIRIVGNLPRGPGLYALVFNEDGLLMHRGEVPYGNYAAEKPGVIDIPADGKAQQYVVKLLGQSQNIEAIVLPITDLPHEVYSDSFYSFGHVAGRQRMVAFQTPRDGKPLEFHGYKGEYRILDDAGKVVADSKIVVSADTPDRGKPEVKMSPTLTPGKTYWLEPYGIQYMSNPDSRLYLTFDPPRWFEPDLKWSFTDHKWWKGLLHD